MTFARKFLLALGLVLCFAFCQTSINAQRGHIKVPSTTTSGKGVHTDGQVPITNFEVYLLGPGTTANGAQASYISCDNDDGGVTVGSDDGDTTCYAVADQYGNFSLTGLYYGFTDGTGCTTGAAQTIYIEARKGDVGSTSNPALAFMAIPPSAWNCDYIYNNSGSIFFDVTDFTNEMAAFGLAPFANFSNSGESDGLSSAGTAGKTALLLAFDTIQNYVGVSTGHYTGSDSNLTKQMNTIADVNDACVDRTGTGSPGCSYLISYTTDNGFTGTHVPYDTWLTLASMAQDPTHDVTSEYNLVSGVSPYQPSDSTAPSSWTVYTSGAPVLSSVSALTGGVTSSNSGKKGNFATISGSGLTSSTTSTACPTIVIGFQAVDTTAAGTSCSYTSLYVKIPASPAQSAIGVYLGGLVSNFLPFTIKSN